MTREQYDQLMRQAAALENAGYTEAAQKKREQADAYWNFMADAGSECGLLD